jgi:hypothetical protein
VNGRVLDFGSPVAWYDYDEISNYLTNAKDRDWCIGVMDEATKLFGQRYWKHEMSDMLATSLVACTWVQTVWPWRPLVVVTGPSNSGKTMFFGDALRRIFGKLGAHVEKPTEAGIRQYVRNDAIALLVDEFEHDQHRQKVLELFRASSRGGEVIRGTSDQKGRRFGLRLLPWMAAVETGLKREADRNRYIIFETERPDGRGNGLNLPPEESLANLGMRILAVALTHVFPAVELADWLKRQKFDGVPSRVIESFSVPVAMLASLSCAVGLKDSRISRGILKTGVRIFTTKCGRD